MDFTKLKPAQEEFLKSYKGDRYELSDGKGNIIEQSDTRTFDGHYLKCRRVLKFAFFDKYRLKYQQYKVDKARARSLPNKAEQEEILKFDLEALAKYNEIKQELKQAKTVQELDTVMDKHNRVLREHNFLG